MWVFEGRSSNQEACNFSPLFTSQESETPRHFPWCSFVSIMFNGKGSENYQTFGRPLTRDELFTVAQKFSRNCVNKELNIPPKAEAEFSYRIGQCKKGGRAKPKLSFNGAGLTDAHFRILVEAMASSSPLFSKLEVRNNDIGNKGVSFLLKLLQGQMKLMKVPIDKRLSANFLAHVDLTDNREDIDLKILDEIDTVKPFF